MKGIIMAGGSGTRLWPMTLGVSKQLLPIFDKPMIYYPLTTLIEAGIRDILIISTPQDLPVYEFLLKDGSQWGISLSYCIQEHPAGIAQAFIIGKHFIGKDNVALILGDNVFYGQGIAQTLQNALMQKVGATIFAYYVRNPDRYGVISFDKQAQVIAIEEKPKIPRSNYAVTGLYCYDNNVINVAQELKPSERGELEITDVNNYYLAKNRLQVKILSREVAWLDTGTPESLLAAAHFIQALQERQGLKVGCPEEAAWRMGFINDVKLEMEAQKYIANGYGNYLLELLEQQQFLSSRGKIMRIKKTALPEVSIFELTTFGDSRGFFRELFRVNAYHQFGIKESFVQFNHSRSAKDVLRGLHYQKNYPQGKLISVTRGKILDVVVDIRYGSPTFGKWIAEELSDQNHRQIYIPPGYAHGVLVLSDSADLLYQCTEYYHPEDELSIAWNEPTLNIAWPIKQPILSEKDKKGLFLGDMRVNDLPQYKVVETEMLKSVQDIA